MARKPAVRVSSFIVSTSTHSYGRRRFSRTRRTLWQLPDVDIPKTRYMTRAYLPFVSGQSKRLTRSAPNTATPLLLWSTAPTLVPSSLALAVCELQCASMFGLPATVTLERKQSQPFGLASRIVLLPITFTAGRIITRTGLSVGPSLPDWLEPMPNTLTPVPMVELAGVPFLKGESLPHDAMQASSAAWSLAKAAVERNASRNAV